MAESIGERVTEKRSLIAWSKWREQAEKYDYYMLGVCAALTAYIGQHLQTVALGLNPGSLEIVAAVLCASASLLGVLRVQATLANSLSEWVALDAHEKAGGMKSVLLSNLGMPVIDKISGDAFPYHVALQRVEQNEHKASEVRTSGKKWTARALWTFKWRDRALLGGIACYGASKVLPSILLTLGAR
jgi:hypothetical protein